MKKLLSISEVVDETGLGRTKLYEEMNAGRLRFVKIGRRRLVPVAAVDEFIGAAASSAVSGNAVG